MTPEEERAVVRAARQFNFESSFYGVLTVAALVLLLYGCFAGCGNPTATKPKLAIPDQVTSPYVEFVGDQITLGMLATATNPLWKCSLCGSGLDSTQALAVFPKVLALKPDIVHILVGAFELTGGGDAVEGLVPFQNIQTMVNQAKSAGVPVMVGQVPPCPLIAGYDLNIELLTAFEGMVGEPATEVGVPLVLYSGIGPVVTPEETSPVCASGYLPNASGYGLMVGLAQQAIQGLHAGEVR